jgi:hypothetical protein
MNYLALVSILAFVSCSPPGQAAALITAQEAQLPRAVIGAPPPPPVKPPGPERGTPLRPPDVSVASPVGAVTSPFLLRVAFKPHNSAQIDPDNVTVTLLTKPEVDLTNRLRPYISANGVNFPQAEAPPGRFPLRITLVDSADNLVTYTIDLQVQHP